MVISEWWVKVRSRAVSIVAVLGALAAVLSLWTNLDWMAGWLKTPLTVFAPLGLLGIAALELFFSEHRRVYSKGNPKIEAYLCKWIQTGGRVAIWTRDFTWATSDRVRGMLRDKAKRGELVLFLPQQTDLTRDLATRGAEVIAYGAHRLDSPASRFTIVHFGSAGARVAVGRAEGSKHAIEEFSADSHVAFHLASDLVALARATQAKA